MLRTRWQNNEVDRTIKAILLLTAVLALIFRPQSSLAQSLTGTSGLITIPTAEILKDGEVSFGANFMNKEYFAYGDNKYHGLANFATIGYLPFLEISFRLTRKLDYPEPQAIGDRMVSVRLRPLKESRFFPAFALGIHDFARVTGTVIPTNNFNALYLSASKGFGLRPVIDRIDFHLGYGTDWIEALDHQFVGPFGGVSISPRPFIRFILEHDAEKLNCGLRISILDHIDFLAALIDFKVVSGGTSFRFRL
jgi:hypothetical protein